MDMATAHLISGLPCSGKTTYAQALKGDTDSVLFSLDRWLITAFGKYSIAEIGHEEHTRRVLACRTLIWDAASECLRRGVDVILDDGFFFREHRMRYVRLCEAIGARITIHFITAPLELIHARLAARNANLPAYNFLIDPDTLRGFEGLFEPPSEDEGAALVVVRTPSPGAGTRADA